MLLHIGTFKLDIDSKRQTFWHDLLPQTRILCVVLPVVAFSLTPNGHWWTWAIYAIGIAVVLLLSQVTFSVLLKRLAVESGFVGIVLIGTLFRNGGEVIWQWGWLRITTEGLTVLGSVTSKAFLSLVLLNLLTLTTSVPQLLQGLTILRVPPLLIAILAAMYRYMAVLVNEFNAMKRAATSRNLMSRNRWQRIVLGHTIGALFIRTYERGERIHQAMLARGYQGVPPMEEAPKQKRRDSIALTITMIWTLLGQAIYVFR